jgi:hypothetical protein
MTECTVSIVSGENILTEIIENGSHAGISSLVIEEKNKGIHTIQTNEPPILLFGNDINTDKIVINITEKQQQNVVQTTVWPLASLQANTLYEVYDMENNTLSLYKTDINNNVFSVTDAIGSAEDVADLFVDSSGQPIQAL